MFEKVDCRRCGTELTGAMENTVVTSGRFVFVTVRETTDCNWSKCPCCGQVLCKRCRARLPNRCCREGRIIERERVRAAAALGIKSANGVPNLD